MQTTATAPLRSPASPARPESVPPQAVISELEKHLLLDGFKIVFDTQRSHGSHLVDARTGREWVDLYGFYASQPIGYNHPHFDQPAVQEALLNAAAVKVANADMYSTQMATFVATLARVMGAEELPRYFFIEGGALAVENALKAAMDWKVRKNIAAGKGERGTEILHFKHAFHGRSGYTMSLTNTDPHKVQHFAKFPWPRVDAPKLNFALPESERLAAVITSEETVEKEIRKVIVDKGQDIAAIIIEPIQGEGGDNHFRGEWLQTLRHICDEHDILLIFDEVQSGMGITGRNWCWQHFGVAPDLMAFGKKSQVCGVMAGSRLDEVPDNVFRLPGRISSTFGGNFTDFVRSTEYLRIIEEEDLVNNAARMGEQFLAELTGLAKRQPAVTAVRGRGLMLAFDLPDNARRDAFWKGCYELGLLVIRSGDHSIRLRPVLDVKTEIIKNSIVIMDQQAAKL